MAATDRGSYCFVVCWCPHSSDCATGVWLETSLAIRNYSLSPKFKTLSEYSLRCYYRLIIFFKTSPRRTHGLKPTTEPKWILQLTAITHLVSSPLEAATVLRKSKR
jgi:hypothetical protein